MRISANRRSYDAVKIATFSFFDADLGVLVTVVDEVSAAARLPCGIPRQTDRLGSVGELARRLLSVMGEKGEPPMKRNRQRTATIFSQTGSSIAELVVTVGIIASVMGTGVLSIERDYLDLATAKQNLVTDLRRARMQATLKGAHFRFEAEGNSYAISRLADADGDGVWEVDEEFTPKTVDLPAGVTIAAPLPAEFDGRGLLVPDGNGYTGIVTLYMSDGEGSSKIIQVWPSGQVEEVTVGSGVTAG